MEPEVLNLETGLRALIILSVIPIVLFLIWADAFERSIHELLIKNPQFDRDPELERIRVASLCVLLFQLTLFLGSAEIRNKFPLVTEALFAGTIIVQLWFQSRTERKVLPASSPTSETPEDYTVARIVWGSVFTWILGTVVFAIPLMVAVVIATWTSDRLHIPQNSATALLMISGVAGTLIGLLNHKILSPFYLRIALPTEPLADQEINSSLKSCFTQAGIQPPEIRVIKLNNPVFKFVVLSGVSLGGLQTLFISKGSLKELSPSEMRAMVLNYVSHASLSHFRNQSLLSGLLVAATALLPLPIQAIAPGLYLFATLAIMYGSIRLLGRQKKSQELAADLHSIQKLGVHFDDFKAALRKMDPPIIPQEHNPSVEDRIQLVARHLPDNAEYEVEMRKAS